MKLFATAFILSCSAFAHEYAVLSDGSRIAIERYENDGPMIRLTTGLGEMDMPAQSVIRIDVGPPGEDSPLFPESGAPISLPDAGWFVPPPASKPSTFTKVVNPRALIRAAAKKHQVREALVASIVRAESNFNPDAVSPKGAIGFMQLMPETAQLLGADPTVPEQNIDAGTRYLRILIDRYQKYRNSLRRVIAAYNAGPGVVDRYRGVPPYRETREYVARVMTFLRLYEKRRG
jgi:transglycosylase-like protein with SLT domain